MKKLTLLLVALLLTGCTTRTVTEPITAKYGGADADTQMEFWHALYESKLTSYEEAFHGLLLFIDPNDVPVDYAGKVAALKSRGLLPAEFDKPGHQAAERGDLAVVIINLLKPKRDVIATLFPHSPRYADRELQYAGLFPPGSPWQSFTGGQYVSIVGRLEDYSRTNPTDLPAKTLPEGDQPKEDVQPARKDEAKPVAMSK